LVMPQATAILVLRVAPLPRCSVTRCVMPNRSKSVYKVTQAICDAVVALTDAFCRAHLNDEYRDLAQAMTAALCRKRPNPLASG
jgi:hypothetical protein